MVIVRDGKEITLTRNEMASCYWELEHIWDEEYISGSLLEQYEEDIPDAVANRLKNDPVFRSRVAYRYRKYLEDQYGSDVELECLIGAIDYAVKCEK